MEMEHTGWVWAGGWKHRQNHTEKQIDDCNTRDRLAESASVEFTRIKSVLAPDKSAEDGHSP